MYSVYSIFAEKIIVMSVIFREAVAFSLQQSKSSDSELSYHTFNVTHVTNSKDVL